MLRGEMADIVGLHFFRPKRPSEAEQSAFVFLRVSGTEISQVPRERPKPSRSQFPAAKGRVEKTLIEHKLQKKKAAILGVLPFCPTGPPEAGKSVFAFLLVAGPEIYPSAQRLPENQ